MCFTLKLGSLGCGIGYGYLHRIPIRLLPEEQPSKPLIGTAVAPAIPFVPPLANTFTSTAANTSIQEQTSTSETTPLTTTEITDTLTFGIANVKLPDDQSDGTTSTSNYVPYGPATTVYTHTTTQHNVFGNVPPTSVPSLNESFNIPPSINNSVQNQQSGSVPASVYSKSL